MDKYIGKKLDGRYAIVELIGVGGMANVYKAYDVTDERMVAVKILREEYLDNPEFLRRFRNESKAIAVLSHPNIVRVYDVIFSERMQSIVMEYIEGITLKEYIQNKGALNWKETVHCTVQILRALQHAHDKGIVHRDVKPQNIMLQQDGTIKITDFGIARFSRSETRTITDRAIGSVHYISPEQASGDTTDARSDLYSVGVMMFEMLTGKVPFEADSAVSVAIKQIQTAPKRPRDINPSIPEGLEEIVVRAMQKDKNRRYQSAAEMLRDIDEFKRNPSISFEYKYMNEPSVPQAGMVPKTSGERRVKKPKETGNMGKGKSRKEPRDPSQPRKIPLLPVLGGITAAFVIVCGLFILMLFIINDPFGDVPEIQAPNLVGENFDQIKDSAEYKDKMKIVVEEAQFHSEYPAGIIFEQSPNAGRKMKEGGTVKVKVSSGTKMVTLPEFVGQDATDVYKQLKDMGLQFEEFAVFSDTIAEGKVTKIDPGSGKEIPASSVVTVYVSRGQQVATAYIPDVVGMNIEEAKKLLRSYKLRNIKIVVTESDEATGTVLSQTPQANSTEKVPVSTAIILEISGEADTGELKMLSFNMDLPTTMDKVVEIVMTQDNKEVAREEINPAEEQSWRITVEGRYTSQLEIKIDNKTYKVFEVNFVDNTYKTVTDNSKNFQ